MLTILHTLKQLGIYIVVIIASSCIPSTVLRLSMKQDNAPVKAQSYSHIFSTGKHSVKSI